MVLQKITKRAKSVIQFVDILKTLVATTFSYKSMNMENLIENKTNQNKKGEEDGEPKKKRPVIKSATDLQRLKLEKLMKNPEKPIIIPEPPKEKDYMQTVPSFVRNVMGSSAGAGSGEFHVYRHLRRKEYARQKCIQAKSMREQLDDEYKAKLDKNRLAAEDKTAKKRAKRLKKKQRAKKPKTNQTSERIDRNDKDEEKKDISEEEQDEEEDDEVEDEQEAKEEESSVTDIAEKEVTDDVIGPTAIKLEEGSEINLDDDKQTKPETKSDTDAGEKDDQRELQESVNT